MADITISKRLRESVLFVLGCVIILAEILNDIIRDKPIHASILLLGGSLAGIGVVQGISNAK